MQDLGSPPQPVRSLVIAPADDASGALVRTLTDAFRHQAHHVPPADLAAIDQALAEGPDALVYRLGPAGPDPLRLLLERRKMAVVVLLDHLDRDQLARLTALPIHACLLDPVSPEQVGVALEVAVARHREQSHLASESERLQQTLNNRKVIERAKGALMKRYRWTEPEAFRRLQRGAMNRRVPMVDLARQILDGHDVQL
jgi:response regulator NasT